MGGERMRDAGVNTLFGIERMGAVGFVEIFSDFGHYFSVYRALVKEIASLKYTAVILIDSPTLNLRLAKHSRKHVVLSIILSALRFGHGERAE